MSPIDVVNVAVALAIGFAIGRCRTRAFQNRGEARLSQAVKKRFPPPDYFLLNHLTLPKRDGTTQIDHVLVSRFGVFVIETKDYSGWIFGGASDRNWTQVLYRTKFKFQNPLHQNDAHVRVIRKLIDFLPAEEIVSAVVFTGNAEFKAPLPEGVFTIETFLAFVESRTTGIMSTNRVQFCVGRLETARFSITKMTDVEHVELLRRRYRSRD